MAKILYEVTENKNRFNKAYGKWFGHIKALETLNTRKLANHISEHGSIYTPDVVYGVLEKFRSCLVEILENTQGGAEKKEDYNVGKHMKALHIRFLPEQEQEMNLSSREFIKQAEFINVDSLTKEEKEPAEEEPETPGGGE